MGVNWRDVIVRSFAPRKDDGHEISLRNGRRLSIATRSLSGEPGQLVLLTDLTETRRLQDQLARHERLSSPGRMVASLAHQIRTPLSTALLYASHLEQGGLSEQQQQRFAGSLKARLHELEHRVRDMLVFARGDLPLNDRVTPAELLSALRAAAEPKLGMPPCAGRTMRKAASFCNRDTLVGALLNLVENALQACSGACRLKIHLYRRDATLYLCISDNGRGIEAGVPGGWASRSSLPGTTEPASGLRSRRLSPMRIKASCVCFPGRSRHLRHRCVAVDSYRSEGRVS